MIEIGWHEDVAETPEFEEASPNGHDHSGWWEGGGRSAYGDEDINGHESTAWDTCIKSMVAALYTARDVEVDPVANCFRIALKQKIEMAFPTVMDKQEGIEKGLMLQVVKDILSKYNSTGEHSNVVITDAAGQIHIDCHVEVLCAHSEYCRVLFSEYWWAERSRDSSMHLEGTVNRHALSLLLDYFYTGDFDSLISSEHLLAIVTLSFELVCTELIGDFIPRLYNIVNDDNYMELLAIADLHGLDQLKARCAAVFIKRMCDRDLSRRQQIAISPEAAEAMKTLRIAFEQSCELNGDIYDDAKELVCMLRDSHNEAEDSYAESKCRNDNDIISCRSQMSILEGSRLLSTQRKLNELNAYEMRLLKVDDSLKAQRASLDKAGQFIEKQVAALKKLFSTTEMLFQCGSDEGEGVNTEHCEVNDDIIN